MDVTQAQRWHIAPARSEAELEQLEAAYRVLDLYIWLSFRLENAFTGAQAPCTTLCSKGLNPSYMCTYTPRLLQKWDGDLPAQKLNMMVSNCCRADRSGEAESNGGVPYRGGSASVSSARQAND